MRNVYERLVKRAYVLVKYVTEKYKEDKKVAFFPALAGMGNCKIEYCGNGHNSDAVVDAINQYYDDTKDVDVINGFEDGILTMIKMSKNILCLHDTLDIIYYQCDLENKNKAKFKLNRERMIDAFNKHIEENFEEFKKIDKFENWYVEQKVYAKSKFDIDLY